VADSPIAPVPGSVPGSRYGPIPAGSMTALGPGPAMGEPCEMTGTSEPPAADLGRQRPDELSLLVRGPRHRLLTHCRAVP
jgi:hypothetical protein